jgi:hypothetical protein
MGINYYAFTTDREAAEAITDKFVLTDEPKFGYLIHICKFNYGWLPLFESHKEIHSFKDLERHMKNFEIINEYSERIDWDDLAANVQRLYEKHKQSPLRSHSRIFPGNTLENSNQDIEEFEFTPLEFS